jgi:hypothetical protein
VPTSTYSAFVASHIGQGAETWLLQSLKQAAKLAKQVRLEKKAKDSEPDSSDSYYHVAQTDRRLVQIVEMAGLFATPRRRSGSFLRCFSAQLLFIHVVHVNPTGNGADPYGMEKFVLPEEKKLQRRAHI